MAAYLKRVGPAQLAKAQPTSWVPPLTKYRAIRTEGVGGRTYDSKAEKLLADELELERLAGGIVAAVPQVSIPCGRDEKGRDVRYRADFMVITEVRADGTFVGKFLDRKGIDTPTSRAKRAALRSLWGLSVELVR